MGWFFEATISMKSIAVSSVRTKLNLGSQHLKIVVVMLRRQRLKPLIPRNNPKKHSLTEISGLKLRSHHFLKLLNLVPGRRLCVHAKKLIEANVGRSSWVRFNILWMIHLTAKKFANINIHPIYISSYRAKTKTKRA